jgi:hypothetical protein
VRPARRRCGSGPESGPACGSRTLLWGLIPGQGVGDLQVLIVWFQLCATFSPPYERIESALVSCS